MGTLAYEIINIMQGLGDDFPKYISIASNKAKFKEVVELIWKDPQAHHLILSHINAFYVRKDDRPRIGQDKNEDHYICEICSDDPLIRSELDTHRELISLELQKRGIRFDNLYIKPARRGMKDRHPFINEIP